MCSSVNQTSLKYTFPFLSHPPQIPTNSWQQKAIELKWITEQSYRKCHNHDFAKGLCPLHSSTQEWWWKADPRKEVL